MRIARISLHPPLKAKAQGVEHLPRLALDPLSQVVPDLDGEMLPIQHLHLAQRIPLKLLGLNPARHGCSPKGEDKSFVPKRSPGLPVPCSAIKGPKDSDEARLLPSPQARFPVRGREMATLPFQQGTLQAGG